MRLSEAENGVRRLIRKLERLVDSARDFNADDDLGQGLAFDIPLTPRELYGYGSVYNPFLRLFQDREPNDIDLILVTEEMNEFQRQRHIWCSDDRERRSQPCISCADDRMARKLSWFIKRYIGPGLKIVIGDVEQDEDIKSGLIRREQLLPLWKSSCQELASLPKALTLEETAGDGYCPQAPSTQAFPRRRPFWIGR